MHLVMCANGRVLIEEARGGGRSWLTLPVGVGAVRRRGTTVGGNAQLLVGHDDSQQHTTTMLGSCRANKQVQLTRPRVPNGWFWQQVSVDNGDLASDTDMQIPERHLI